MTSKTITFTGRGRDQHGMPEPFYSYLLIESQQPRMGDLYYIASIVPLTDGPMPTQKHFITDRGMGQAMTLATDALKGLAQMRGLQVQEP